MAHFVLESAVFQASSAGGCCAGSYGKKSKNALRQCTEALHRGAAPGAGAASAQRCRTAALPACAPPQGNIKPQSQVQRRTSRADLASAFSARRSAPNDKRHTSLPHLTPHTPPRHRYLISTYSSMPWCEPSRPRPDCLTPPKGTCSALISPVLMPTMPLSSASATRKMRPTSRL